MGALILFILITGIVWLLTMFEHFKSAMVLFIGFLVLSFMWHSDTRYSLEYAASYDNVYQAPRPVDCDFLGSPIGDKGCHYDRVVNADTSGAVHTVSVSWARVEGDN